MSIRARRTRVAAFAAALTAIALGVAFLSSPTGPQTALQWTLIAVMAAAAWPLFGWVMTRRSRVRK